MSGRTPEERERARWERAAKRAADRGEPPPPLPPELAEPQAPAGGEAPEARAPAEPVQPPEPEPAPPVEPAAPVEPPAAAEAAAPEHQAEPEPYAEPERYAEPEPVVYEDPEHYDGPESDGYDEPRYQADEEHLPPVPPPPFERRGRGAVPGRPGGPGYRRGGPGARRGLVAAVAVVSGLLLVVVAWLAMSLFQPLKGDGTGEVAIAIPEGSGTSEIADILEREGVISSATFFRLRASLSGQGGDFKAGEFTLREDMSYGAAIDALVEAPVADTVTVTIPEGLSRREAGATVRQSGVRGDYMAATRSAPRFPLARYGAREARNLEGFLFPATYELEPGQRVKTLVDQQLAAFQREFAKVNMRYARSKNLTPYDVVIIASMIDREAMIPRERRLVASVIYNRLNQGIPLGIDATIRFATNNWSEPLKESELAIDSGYNTRLNQGLPPGPIGNPGLAALRAAANPAETDFIYYVVKPCANGAHAFSSSDAEFQRDVARYNAERERQGGQSPTEC